VGEHNPASHVLRAAFRSARLAGRGTVCEVLKDGAATLAALDRGQTLWRIYEAVIEIDSWWGVG
jgi:hypothetical protein